MTIPIVGKDTEKMGHIYSTGGNAKQNSHSGSLAGLKRIKYTTIIQSSKCILGIYSREMKTYLQTNFHSRLRCNSETRNKKL